MKAKKVASDYILIILLVVVMVVVFVATLYPFLNSLAISLNQANDTTLGGITVYPGDIILADPDGIIAIPRRDAAQILEDAKKFQAADEKKLEAAKNGTANRAWVEKSLADKGYEIIDDYYRP